MTLGNWIEAIITWGSAVLGAWALLHHARRRWGWRFRLAILQARGIIDHYVAQWQESQFRQKHGLADTYQVEPVVREVVRAGSVPVPNRENLIRIAALIRNEDGTYTHSANKIAEFVGGTRAETLAAIRELRGAPAEPAEPYDPVKHLSLDGGKRWITRT